MWKAVAMSLSCLLALGLGAFTPAQPPPEGPPPEKAKWKESGPEDDLKKAYDLLRRLRADDGFAGKPDRQLHDWVERSTDLYRRAVRARNDDPRLAHEYGAAAHDLARAVDHARNAQRLDRRDPDLPPPPEVAGPEATAERARRDLWHAYDRIRGLRAAEPVPGGDYYRDAARDLYNAARRDLEEGRPERGVELARAAEAITHVPEHLGHALGRGPEPPPDPKAAPGRVEPRRRFAPPPGPDGEPPALPERRGADLPPPLPE